MTRCELSDLAATEALAARLARAVQPGDVLALHGDMGVGKTAFARAFIRALMSDPHAVVPSPTFSLVQVYDTSRGVVAHFDLWRLNGPEELVELGWDEAQEGVLLVEWPERAQEALPESALHLYFDYGAHEGSREVHLEGGRRDDDTHHPAG